MTSDTWPAGGEIDVLGKFLNWTFSKRALVLSRDGWLKLIVCS